MNPNARDINELSTHSNFYKFASWMDNLHRISNNLWLTLNFRQQCAFLWYVQLYLDAVQKEEWQAYKPLLTHVEYFSLFLKGASKLKGGEALNKLDCWLSDNTDNGGYVYFHSGGNREKSARLIYGLVPGNSCFISKGPNEADHACVKPNCINPYHIRMVTSKENKSTCGQFGAACYCNHHPKCIWTDESGKQKKHKNDPDFAYQRHECDCETNCFI